MDSKFLMADGHSVKRSDGTTFAVADNQLCAHSTANAINFRTALRERINAGAMQFTADELTTLIEQPKN